MLITYCGHVSTVPLLSNGGYIRFTIPVLAKVSQYIGLYIN
jgi:hypothetical protein